MIPGIEQLLNKSRLSLDISLYPFTHAGETKAIHEKSLGRIMKNNFFSNLMTRIGT